MHWNFSYNQMGTMDNMRSFLCVKVFKKQLRIYFSFSQGLLELISRTSIISHQQFNLHSTKTCMFLDWSTWRNLSQTWRDYVDYTEKLLAHSERRPSRCETTVLFTKPWNPKETYNRINQYYSLEMSAFIGLYRNGLICGAH